MTYGEKIASLRKQHNMTQSELGDALNVTFQAVSKWENGASEPDLATIKKLCEIFSISTNEFFDLTEEKHPEQTPQAQPTVQPVVQPEEQPSKPTTVIVKPRQTPLAYCEQCKKPLYNKADYVVKNIRHGRGPSTQHVYCNACIQQQQSAEAARKKAETRAQRKKGFIWGAVGGILLSVGLIIAGVTTNDNLMAILGGTLGIYGGFAFISQMIWENSVLDCFCFFLKSFKLPGVIFTLDIGGIIFLITVKILGAILCTILSVILFVLGLIVTIGYSMLSFPIAVIKQIRGEY